MFTLGIYTRKSVFRFNSDSVAVQIDTCKDYAAFTFKGQDIEFRIYDQDEGFSGKNMERPGFQALMEDVQSGILNAVVVYKLDRISRSVKDFSDIYDIMHAHNVSFHSVKESFDTSTPIGRTVMYILAAFAQLERETTAERVSDNMLALGAAGYWTGGHIPTGMTSIRKIAGGKEHSYLVTDPEQIQLVKYLGNLFLSGYSISKLEKHCRANNIRTQRGAYLQTSQIHLILSNPVYCRNDLEAYYYFAEKGHTMPNKSLFDGTRGLIAYGRTEQTNGQKKKSTYTISIGIHEPVFTGAEFIQIQNRFGQNKVCRTAKYHIGILKGVLRCSCGCKMEVRTHIDNGQPISYYYCSKMRRMGRTACNTGYTRVEKLDDTFIQKLKEIQLSPEKISLQEPSGTPLSPKKLQADLKALNTSIHNLMTSLEQNTESSAASYIIARIEQLDREKRNLEASLRKAELAEHNRQAMDETRNQIYQNVCALLDGFEDMEYREKNELVKKTVESCIFEDGKLNIIF